MTIKEIIRDLELLKTSPTKSLGQNFLFDQNLARWVVTQLEIRPNDHVVEIGPGLGALTEILAAQPISLTLIEKDDRLIEYLRKKFDAPHIRIHHADAVTFDTRQLLGRGPLKIIGNLPYYVSTPILDRFADPVLGPERLVFTLQRELADRLNARPRTKAYGAMTVCVGRRWAVRSLRTLPPSVFYPEPKVESAVILMTPRPAADVPVCDDTLFDSLVRTGFSERRKQLRKLLVNHRERWPAAAESLGITETARAEELSVAQWTALKCLLAPVHAQNHEEIFDVVDENDFVTDSLPRGEVHARDLRHRAIHVLIFNAAGDVFLQKRSIWKDRSPGRWDSSTAGHVDAGETYEQAAHREMAEEIGVTGCTLIPLFKLGSGPETGWEFLQIYRTTHEGPFRYAGTEVEGGAYFSIDHVHAWLADFPGDFTPVFRLAFPRICPGAEVASPDQDG